MDFASIEIDIRVQNTTTSTSFPSAAKILLVELLERGVTIETTPRCCALGHHLLLDFEVTKAGKPICTFTSTGKVEEQKYVEGDVDRIGISFVQFEEESWKAFRATFTLRQEQINQFMKAARGW